jgi:hypothetical protein
MYNSKKSEMGVKNADPYMLKQSVHSTHSVPRGMSVIKRIKGTASVKALTSIGNDSYNYPKTKLFSLDKKGSVAS